MAESSAAYAKRKLFQHSVRDVAMTGLFAGHSPDLLKDMQKPVQRFVQPQFTGQQRATFRIPLHRKALALPSQSYRNMRQPFRDSL